MCIPLGASRLVWLVIMLLALAALNLLHLLAGGPVEELVVLVTSDSPAETVEVPLNEAIFNNRFEAVGEIPHMGNPLASAREVMTRIADDGNEQ